MSHSKSMVYWNYINNIASLFNLSITLLYQCLSNHQADITVFVHTLHTKLFT